MVWAPPVAPMVYAVNILCRLLTCKYPYDHPQIVYDNSGDLISLQYSNNKSGHALGTNYGKEEDNYYDVGAAPEPNVVETGSGRVEGYYMTTSGGRRIGAWEGIKYGKAHRWEKSYPVPPWGGIIQAKAPGPDCLQFNVRKIFRIYGKEDCLYLNVYSPVISGNKQRAQLPVVVYIHGGSFLFGTGKDYGPSYLLNEDIVLVTFNYRLGVLGFMSTGDRILPGNWGLKDQRLAMTWAKDNVAAFGGDPEQITLWGYSAGAVSVHLHMMTNGSEALFQRGISQSGTAFVQWGVHPPWRVRGFTEQLAEYFKCPIKDGDEMVNCLKTIEPSSLVGAQVHLVKWMPFPPVIFGPTLEVETDDPDSIFIADWPHDLYKKGLVAKKPWIVSTTQHEALSGIMAMELMQRWSLTKLFWHSVAKYVLDLEYLELKNTKKVVDKITRYYLGGKGSAAGTPFEYSDMITDRYFHVAVVKGIQAHSEIAPTFAYYFSFSSGNYSLGDWNLHRPTEWGAGHGEDENYFFNSTANFPGFKRNDPEYGLSKIMLNFATNFVMNGTPTFTPTSGSELWKGPLTPLSWEPVTNPRKIGVLQFDNEIKMIVPNLKRAKFWQDLNLPDANLWVKL